MSGKSIIQSLGFSTDRWLGLQCVHVERQHLPLLRRERFLVCEKTDGIRSLLCAAGGELHLVDRAYNGTRVHTLAPMEPTERTILDGELTNGMFVVFDAVMVSGAMVGVNELPVRLQAAEQWIVRNAANLGDLIVEIKGMVPWAQVLTSERAAYGPDPTASCSPPLLRSSSAGSRP
jgi:hypothetical protein